MKRVLLVKGADICYGGVSVLLYQLMKAMDRSDLQVDLYTFGGIDAKDLYDQYCAIGVNVILGGHPDYNPKEVAADLNRLLRETRYDVVHSNTGRLQMTAIAMGVAFLHRVPLRIAHSHNTNPSGSAHYGVRSRMYQCANTLLSNCRLGCSVVASEHLFGKRGARKSSVLKNAIDIPKYIYDPARKRAMRERLGIPQDALVVGHVGRFVPQKNHAFLLEIFAAVKAECEDAVLALIGDGPLLPDVRQQAERLGLSDSVRFLGVTDRVADYLQAFDVFVLPSLYEGLPIVAVEAQAADLPVVCSDSISGEVAITSKVRMVSLNTPAEEWKREILSAAAQRADRKQNSDELIRAGYDIADSARELYRIYLNCGRKK